MLYANSSIETSINQTIRELPAEDKRFIDDKPLMRDNDLIRYVRVRNQAFIILHDYNGDKFIEDHRLGGLVVTIASVNSSRGNGDTDYLIKNAISDMRTMPDHNSRCLVAELHRDNVHAINLFRRNGFTPGLEDSEKIYYLCYTRS